MSEDPKHAAFIAELISEIAINRPAGRNFVFIVFFHFDFQSLSLVNHRPNGKLRTSKQPESPVYKAREPCHAIAFQLLTRSFQHLSALYVRVDVGYYGLKSDLKRYKEHGKG
jgi:hypothetical protein